MSKDTRQKRSSGTNINFEETAEADSIDIRKDKEEGTRQDRPRDQPVVEGRNIGCRLGSINEEDTDNESTEDKKDWSKEEFLFSYNGAPE